jgi:hypothetical protein
VRASFFVVGVAAALLAGCGGIGNAAGGTAGAAKTSPSPGRGAVGNNVVGQLVKLASGRMTVSDQAGNVAVSYDSSTTVLQSGTGSLADAAAGTCVTAAGEKDASGAVAATTLQVELNMNGNCTQPGGGFGGGQSPGPGQSPRPGGRAGQGSPRPAQSPGGGALPANLTAVRGKVASVSGSTLTVQPQTGAPVTVTVPSTARITRLVSSTPARLAVGECITANGQRDSSGTVKARSVLISAPGPNGCTRAGGFGPGGRPSASPRTQNG